LVRPEAPADGAAPEVEFRLVDDTCVFRAPSYRDISVLSLYGKAWGQEA
jgi:hypothetical protein